MNALLLSAGRQVMLVEAFRKAQSGRHRVGQVLAADIDPLAPALAAADLGFVAPQTANVGFLPWIEALCARYAPLLILTLFERDLFVLEPVRRRLDKLEACLVGMPTASLEICIDKLKTMELCHAIGLAAPPTWSGDSLASIPEKFYPIIVKERAGRGSRGQQYVRRPEDLGKVMETDRTDLCGQQVVEGTEHGLDIINDLDGNFVAVFAREKLVMRDGETAVARTVDSTPFVSLARALGGRLAHQGVLDTDVIVAGRDVFLLDINPRFGGGYPFSHLAGADIPAALLCWASGAVVDPRWFAPEPGLLAAKTSTIIKLRES